MNNDAHCKTNTNKGGAGNMEITIKISRTNAGLPAVAETSGTVGKTKGFARIICREDGDVSNA